MVFYFGRIDDAKTRFTYTRRLKSFDLLFNHFILIARMHHFTRCSGFRYPSNGFTCFVYSYLKLWYLLWSNSTSSVISAERDATWAQVFHLFELLIIQASTERFIFVMVTFLLLIRSNRLFMAYSNVSILDPYSRKMCLIRSYTRFHHSKSMGSEVFLPEYPLHHEFKMTLRPYDTFDKPFVRIVCPKQDAGNLFLRTRNGSTCSFFIQEWQNGYEVYVSCFWLWWISSLSVPFRITWQDFFFNEIISLVIGWPPIRGSDLPVHTHNVSPGMEDFPAPFDLSP